MKNGIVKLGLLSFLFLFGVSGPALGQEQSEEGEWLPLQEEAISPELKGLIEAEPDLKAYLENGGGVRVTVDDLWRATIERESTTVEVHKNVLGYSQEKLRADFDKYNNGVPGPEGNSAPQSMEEYQKRRAGLGGELAKEFGLSFPGLSNGGLESGNLSREELNSEARQKFRKDLMNNPGGSLEPGDQRGEMGGGESSKTYGQAGDLVRKSLGYGNDFDNPANDSSASDSNPNLKNNGGDSQGESKPKIVSYKVAPGINGVKVESIIEDKGIRYSATYEDLVVENGYKQKETGTLDGSAAAATIISSIALRWTPIHGFLFYNASAILGGLINNHENPEADYQSSKERLQAIVKAAASNGPSKSNAGSVIGLGINSPGGTKGPVEMHKNGIHSSDVGGVNSEYGLDPSNTETEDTSVYKTGIPSDSPQNNP